MSYGKAALAKIEDLFKELQTGPNGLSDEEAKRRLLKAGLNVIPKGKKSWLGKEDSFTIQKHVQSSPDCCFISFVSKRLRVP